MNASDAETGIPIMQDLTMVLDDGTEITFKPALASSRYDSKGFSGGLADIASVFITRGNQGVSVTNMNGSNTPVISQPTVEGVDVSVVDPVTETINVSDGSQLNAYVNYGGGDYSKLEDSFRSHLKSVWLSPLNNMTYEEQTAILQSVSSGQSISWQLLDTHNNVDVYDQTFTYTPRGGERLNDFFERIIDESTASFSGYVIAQEGEISIYGIESTMSLPSYSYERQIPEGTKTTSNYSANNVTIDKKYYNSADYGKINNDHAALLSSELKSAVHGMTEEQKLGLKTKLQQDGMGFNWGLQDTNGDHNYYHQDYTIKMIPGEDIDDYFKRAARQTADEFSVYVSLVQGEGSINISSIANNMTIPGFNYDEYTADESDSVENVTYHSFDKDNNDGYVLLESGGVNSWEFDGQSVSHLTRSNPNDATGSETVSGYNARKIAFSDDFSNEFKSGVPILTSAEIDIITNQLKISYPDASGVGNLTSQEWATLKNSLETAKGNLTGSNQLQTVELQRALTVHNQNFDTLSNSQSKIYNLLRDIMNNIK